MKPLPKWFLIPPAAAAIVVLGSLTQGSAAPALTFGCCTPSFGGACRLI